MVRPGNDLAPALDARAVRYVGTVSYGIFLIHMLNINVVRKLVPGGSRLRLFALACPATIAMARLSFRYFETSMMNLKRLFLRNDVPKPTLAAPAP